MAKKKTKGGPSILANVIGGAVFIAAIILAAGIALRAVTQHNVSVAVPDFVGSDMGQALDAAYEGELQLVVTDSVYVKRFRRGAVYAQNPKAGERVKKGRKIYITVNSSHERHVSMPDLVGFSLRQAKVELAASKLKLGKLVYVRDIATNNVLDQMVGENHVDPGKSLAVGTTVNLKLGLNPEDEFTSVPDLTGYKYQRALSALQDNSFNIAGVSFDSSVRTYADSLAAFVYQQYPPVSVENVRLGTEVKLFLTLDASRLPSVEEETSEEVL